MDTTPSFSEADLRLALLKIRDLLDLEDSLLDASGQSECPWCERLARKIREEIEKVV